MPRRLGVFSVRTVPYFWTTSPLDDADARAYCAAHLGYRAGAASGAARTCWLHIPHPNSSIWRYGGRGQGALPFNSFRNNKIEVSFDFYPAEYSAADRNNPSPAITGGQIVMKEVVAPLSQMRRPGSLLHCLTKAHANPGFRGTGGKHGSDRR